MSMQFKVPQNISMEDKIAGPLTMIQFIIAVVGGGVSYLEFIILAPFKPFNLFVSGIFALVTIILALGYFNGQPMYKFFRFFILFIVTPKTRVWHKGGGQVQLVRATPKVSSKQEKSVTKHVSKDDIAHLAAVLDSRGSVGGSIKSH